MNGNTSTTGAMTPEKLPNTAVLASQWKSIDWSWVEAEVNRLQTRIAKATGDKKWNTVKRLHYLLTHSYYAKLLAVRKVTTNKGSKTSGVDKELWRTPASKMRAVLSLTDKSYKSKPLRRVYIEKKGKKAKRPLGIPTMYDRAMQALYALALDPVAEIMGDSRSFGFRKGRSCHDACERIFADLSHDYSPKWVLEGDIKGCFDNISHEWLIQNIPMDQSILKQFLKSGFVFERELFPTEDGTPQGGIISTLLANMALDGMQKLLYDRFHRNPKGKVDVRVQNAHKVNMVRYADDFIVTAATKEIAREAKEVIVNFLAARGLELSEEKTLITHIDDGFDMLGWTFRKYKGKLIIKPSKKAIESSVASLSETILKRGKAWKQDLLILKLNAQIRGWTNYHQSVVASKAFQHIDYIMFELLWRWAKRRHPNKGQRWIARRYWHSRGTRNWVFCTDAVQLVKASDTHIVRHTQVRLDMNPYIDRQYFMDRKFKNGMRRLSGRYKLIWKKQKGSCYHCGMPMDIRDEREIFVKTSKSQPAKEPLLNMAYVHKHCQILYLESCSKE
ncbi:RNA-directed DNA polymerase [Desulfitobacterium hafniense]|uniref:RNA-directed DNA polymerase n=1 Tax=Desulfitobacterium hafniense TaxID=49338 RepID=A0A098AYU1_DESHA|nr:group II intron reverse transcriptase/maturase [Desulfitobacterium hafniense]CDX01779.1 RNA-directed DNA polymerase [Desulfitobacterium hafniense]